jgi:hypothetical protein
MDENTTAFRFNEAVTEPSPMMQKDDEDKPRRKERSD